MKVNKHYIKILIKKKSLKQKDIAAQIGVSPQDFNNWMFRGVFPHYEKLQDLAAILDVDIDEITLDENEKTDEPLLPYTINNIRIDQFIPFYAIDSQTELMTFWEDETPLSPKDMVYLPGVKADFVFPFFGKGMAPELKSGDWLALRRITDFSFFNYGNIYCVVTQEQIMVRYLKRSSKRNHVLLCSSDHFYDDIDLPLKSVKSIFTLVAVIKRETL